MNGYIAEARSISRRYLPGCIYPDEALGGEKCQSRMILAPE